MALIEVQTAFEDEDRSMVEQYERELATMSTHT
jgi:hypothetical protein